MSTYKNMDESAQIETVALPDFLYVYLRYLRDITNFRHATRVEHHTALLQLCRYVRYRSNFGTCPSSPTEVKETPVAAMQIQELCNLDDTFFVEYLTYLESVTKVSSTTVRKKVGILKRFYTYVKDNQEDLGCVLARNPIQSLCVAVDQPDAEQAFSRRDLKRLSNGVTGTNAVRDKAIILILGVTGITLSELVKLNCGDFNDDSLKIAGDKTRTVFLDEECSAAVHRYLTERKSMEEALEPDRPMFVSSNSTRRMTPRAIQVRIRKAAVVAGLGDMDISAKALRGAAAQTMLSKATGPDRAMIMSYLGYTHSNSITRYR